MRAYVNFNQKYSILQRHIAYATLISNTYLQVLKPMTLEETQLKRSISLPMMLLYGLGTTIGAGIYALVGELAKASGTLAPFSFLVAAFMASLTALSFAELSSRYPFAAGEALYIKKGFHSVPLSTLVGLLVATAGLVSAAALINAFVGYLQQFLSVPTLWSIIATALLLGVIAIWGVNESLRVACFITIIEITGLLIIIFVGRHQFMHIKTHWQAFIPHWQWHHFNQIYAGILLSFYAFIGFEDMVNMAEEVKNVRRNLPYAIIGTLIITCILYILVMLTALLSMPIDELVQSHAPLPIIYQHATGQKSTIISIIGTFAIINGALIQVIMASRVLYGLSSKHQLPKIISYINPRTQTPVVATILSTIIVLILSILGELPTLAQTTSMIMLIIFSAINLALWRIKKRKPQVEGIISFPRLIPLCGFFVCSFFVILNMIDFFKKYLGA